MNLRRLALLLGVVALGAGVIVMVSPGLVAVGVDTVVVTGFGLLVLVQAVRVVLASRRDEIDEATTPDPELPATTPPPGEDFEAILAGFHGSKRVFYHRTHVRDALRSAAAAVLSEYGSAKGADVHAALDAGTWTDDPVAAAFLGDETVPTPPLRPQLRSVLRRESSFQRGIRHAVDAIAATAGVVAGTNGRSVTPPSLRSARRRNAGRDESTTQFTTKAAEDWIETDDGTEPEDGVVTRESHPTGHWRGVSVVALVGIGVGVLIEQPAILLAGVVGVGFTAYARSAVLRPGEVSVERTLGETNPDPGEDVEVSVTVTNESGRFLPDVRLVDGVPEALAVSDGSPRIGTALLPGGSASFSYSITARRGVHPFGPVLVVSRDVANATEQERYLPERTSLTCVPPLRPVEEPVPLRERGTQYAGRVETESGGEGVEFYATREYRPGDAMRRIDWNRRARTGELTTIEFRNERAATVVVVIDARETAYVSPDPRTPHAVDRSVDAAGAIFATLTGSGDRVGIAASNSTACWLEPGAGEDHRVRARTLLATHPALAAVPTGGRSSLVRWRKQFRRRSAPGTQVVLLTPLCDDFGARFARRLDEDGYPVTIVSPDPTADRTTGHRLARVARTLRLSALRNAGIPVVDWPSDESIDAALARYDERWSA